MKYKDYKRQVKISKVLDKPLEGDYLNMSHLIDYLTSSLKPSHTEDGKYYLMDGKYIFGLKDDRAYFSDEHISKVLTEDFSMNWSQIRHFIKDLINNHFDCNYSFEDVYGYRNIDGRTRGSLSDILRPDMYRD